MKYLQFAEIKVDNKPNYKYPDPGLMKELVDAYFTQVNAFIPVFHRPTFEKSIADGLHLRDAGFGSVLLVVCAVATAYSNGETFDRETRSSKVSPWFRQVQMSKQTILGPVRLCDVQLYFVGRSSLTAYLT